jgi:hypothetical protein
VKKVTADHIPPKLLFAKPYPGNLLTVPACQPCNASFQLDDEYTRTVVALHLRASNHPDVKSKLPAILRSLSRPNAKSFRTYLANQTVPSIVLDFTGSPMGYLIDADRSRVNATGVHKIRGLHFIETAKMLPPHIRIKLAAKAGLRPDEPSATTIARAFMSCPDRRHKEIGQAFSYAVGFNKSWIVWILMLYEFFIWVATVETKNDLLDFVSVPSSKDNSESPV